MSGLPAHIERWDDERRMGNALIVTLRHGWSYLPNEHEGVRGFDSAADARYESARKRLYRCRCEECRSNAAGRDE